MDENINKFNKEVLRLIRERRKQLKMTQSEMAEKLGIEQATYSSLENGKTELSLNRYMQIAQILDLEQPIVLNDQTSPVSTQNLEKLISTAFEQLEQKLEQKFVSKALLRKLLGDGEEEPPNPEST